jgi:hypothetical protein
LSYSADCTLGGAAGVSLRVDGISATKSATGTSSAPSFGNLATAIGIRTGPVGPFNGRIYSLIVRGAASSAAEIDSAEDWVAAKTGVTLP